MPVVLFVGRVFALVALIGWLVLDPKIPKAQDSLVQVALGLICGSLLQSFASAWGNLRMIATLTRITFQSKPLRISFASLIKIKVGDQYLLVAGRNFKQFQPVGGVYKFFDTDLRRRFGLEDDPLKAKNVEELRLVFPSGGIWRVFGFLKWFNSRKGRESGPHREFAEELINNGILSAQIFADVPFEYVETVTPPIRFSNHLQVFELQCFEIYEAIMSDAQKKAVLALQAVSSSDYCFLTAEEIKKDGFRLGSAVPIGSHTKYII